MSSRAAEAPGPARPVHPIVLLDYLPRVTGYLFATLVIASVLYPLERNYMVWAAIAAQGLVWPHVAYLAALYSRNSRGAELRNLLIDSFATGCWIALLGWSPWPSTTFLACANIGNLSVGSVRFFLRGLGAMAMGNLLGGLLVGFRFLPHSSPLTTTLSIVGILGYTGSFGLFSHIQTRRAAQHRREAEDRTRELTVALEQQKATSNILRAISSSPTDLRQVLDTVAEHAVRLCEADDAQIFRVEGDALSVAASCGSLPLGLDGENRSAPISRDWITGRAVMDRQAVHVHDPSAAPDTEFSRSKAFQRRYGHGTTLATPLLREGMPIGAILLRRRAVRPFSEPQIELLQTFADQAAIAIDNARLFGELETRTEDLGQSLEEVRALSEVIQAVSSSLDLREVLDTVIRHAVTLSDSDAGAVVRFNPVTRTFDGVASYNVGRALLQAIESTPVDPTEGVIGRATQTGQPFQVPDIEAAREFLFRDVSLREGFRALLAAPIAGDNVTRGVVVFRRAPGLFDDRVVRLLTALASQSKVAIDNARLFQEIQTQRIQLETLSKTMEQLYRLSTAMQEPLSLREQLNRVLEAARRMGIFDRVYVWAVTPETGRLVILAGSGFSEEELRELDGTEIPLAEAGAMYKAYRDGAPLVFNEDHPLPPELYLRPPYSELRALRTRRFLVVPMIARGETVGVLVGDNRPSGKPILKTTLNLLQTFASHAAVAIANARLFQASEEKSRQLEVANRHKSQFLANMSHELRTPLNAILGYTEMIRDEIYGPPPEKIRDVLERVAKSGHHLLGLINDVLDLSKMEAGQLTLSLSDYSMRDVVQSVVASVESLALEKRLALRVAVAPDLPPGRGDERRLTQVMLNLIGNAIKFTEAGEVGVRVTASEGAFLVAVSDTGPGVPAADQQRISEEFRQADASVTRAKGGTGLGLSIARRIIEMHGGRIWVESTPGRGSTFWCRLPVRAEALREVPSTP